MRPYIGGIKGTKPREKDNGDSGKGILTIARNELSDLRGGGVRRCMIPQQLT